MDADRILLPGRLRRKRPRPEEDIEAAAADDDDDADVSHVALRSRAEVAADANSTAAIAENDAANAFNVTPAMLAGPSNRAATVWIKELPADLHEPLIYELFTQVGPVRRIMINTSRPRPAEDSSAAAGPVAAGAADGPAASPAAPARRFAHVEFFHECSVAYACRVLGGVTLFGQTLRVEPANSREEREGAMGHLHVAGLSPLIDEHALSDVFSICGPVLDVYIKRDAPAAPPSVGGATSSAGSGRPTFGFVSYRTIDEAATAMFLLTNVSLCGYGLRVGWADRKMGSVPMHQRVAHGQPVFILEGRAASHDGAGADAASVHVDGGAGAEQAPAAAPPSSPPPATINPNVAAVAASLTELPVDAAIVTALRSEAAIVACRRVEALVGYSAPSQSRAQYSYCYGQQPQYGASVQRVRQQQRLNYAGVPSGYYTGEPQHDSASSPQHQRASGGDTGAYVHQSSSAGPGQQHVQNAAAQNWSARGSGAANASSGNHANVDFGEPAIDI